MHKHQNNQLKYIYNILVQIKFILNCLRLTFSIPTRPYNKSVIFSVEPDLQIILEV